MTIQEKKKTTEIELDTLPIEIEEWELSTQKLRRNEYGRSPFVGIPLRKHINKQRMIDEFHFRWFHEDPQIWHIPILERREWYNKIVKHFDSWLRYISLDSTPEFYMNLQDLKENGGILVGINGKKASGKSWLAQMVISRLVDIPPVVLFQYKDLDVYVDPYQYGVIGLLIDEDLKATGHDSKNLVIHVNNTWDTNRKADIFGVLTGVNLSFEGWGDTLDLRLTPLGKNKPTQTTRFAMFDKKNEFLGLAALQRKHSFNDPVIYADTKGVWGEYQSRAEIFSKNVAKHGGALSAVSGESQTEDIETFKVYLREYAKSNPLPTKPIMYRRLYRKADLPSKSVGYMKEVILWTLEEIELEGDLIIPTSHGSTPSFSAGITFTGTEKGWKSLRLELEKLTSAACALYHVPTWPKMTYQDVKRALDMDILVGSVGTNIRRDRQTLRTSTLGKLGESFTLSLIDSLSPRVGGGGKNTPDVVCQVGEAEVALNVKLTLTDDYKEALPTTPEDRWIPRAFVILLIPRLLQIRVYPIQGETTYVHTKKGMPCSPDGLVELLERMVGAVEDGGNET